MAQQKLNNNYVPPATTQMQICPKQIKIFVCSLFLNLNYSVFSAINYYEVCCTGNSGS